MPNELIPIEEFQPDSSIVPLFSGTTGRSATNNNPLNLEYRQGSYQDKYGAEMEPISKSGKQRFARFPTMEAGYLAGLEQIRIDQAKNHTLASFVRKFAPPFENPTGEITKQYAQALGVSPHTPLSEIPADKLIIPMLARESSTRLDRGTERASKIAASTQKLVPLEEFMGGTQTDNLVPVNDFTQNQGKVDTVSNPLNAPGAQVGTSPVLQSSPTPLHEMTYQDPQAMKEAVLNPPNMGYRPGIVRPMLQATGMGLGGVAGSSAGPLGTVAGGTLGYGMAEKAADVLD